MDNHTLLIIFVALTGLSVLIQAVVLIGILMAMKKTAAMVAETTTDLKATVLPVIHQTRDLVQRISPQVVSVTNGLSELTELVRKEAKEVNISASEIMGRVNRQTARLDQMLTSTLNVLDRTGSLLENAVSTPVRQANGVFAAVRAVIDTYRSTNPRSEDVRRSPSRAATAATPSPAPYTNVKVSEADKDFVI